MAFRLSMLSRCAILNSNALYAINVYLCSLESKQNYLKRLFYENGASDTKKLELVYKMNQ